MAKLTRTKGGTPRVNINKDVRRIRARFIEARALGIPNEEAARLAHGSDTIAPSATLAAAEEVQQETRPTATHTAHIAGNPISDQLKVDSDTAAEVVRNDIPPNWQDLPWPHLRKLAAQFSGGINPASRKEAEEIITKALG